MRATPVGTQMCGVVDPSSSSDDCRIAQRGRSVATTLCPASRPKEALDQLATGSMTFVPIDPPRVCHWQLTTLARADLSTRVLVGKSAHSSVEEGSLTWKTDSSSLLRQVHEHLHRRHCGAKVIVGGLAFGEEVGRSRDDSVCVCHKIKEGLRSLSWRCANALTDADYVRGGRPLPKTGRVGYAS